METPNATRQLILGSWLMVLPATQFVTAFSYRDAAPMRMYAASALLLVGIALAQGLVQWVHRHKPAALGDSAWQGLATAMLVAACLVQGTIGALFATLPGNEQRMLVIVALGFLVAVVPARGFGLRFWLATLALLGPVGLVLASGAAGQRPVPITLLVVLAGLLALFKAVTYDGGQTPDAAEEEMPMRDDAKPQFLAKLSHKLRTPMAGVIGTIELLEREPLSKYQRQLVQTVQLAASDLLEVINEELDHPEAATPGSVYRERLLVSLEEIAREAAEEEAERHDATNTVLVVDDSELNLDVLCQQLRTLGMPVETAADGLQGLAKWRARRYAMVIADIQMPGMDGLEMTRQIRVEEASSGGSRRTPIVALSANAQRGGDEEALAAGFDGYLTKPLMLRRLQETLNQWIDRRDAAAAAPAPAAPEPPPAVNAVDRQALMDMVGGNIDVVESVLQRFSSAGADLVKEIAAAANDGDRLKKLAHKLKGTARAVSAVRLGDLAEKLETSRSAADIAAVEAEWRRVAATLERWRASVSA